ncbi:hypothetical protein GQ600_10726 [Phytophthora cactorum]|nr:hypothetical protein GQ600_10726 [Phytophthora cactorum]
MRKALAEPEIIDLTTQSIENSEDTSSNGQEELLESLIDKKLESEKEYMSVCSDPPRFDDSAAEPLSFTEMFEYLRSELRGLTLDQAMDVESAQEFIQDYSRRSLWQGPLSHCNQRESHPELIAEEIEKMTQQFVTDIQDDTTNARKWRARLHDLTLFWKPLRSANKQLGQSRTHRPTHGWRECPTLQP